MVIPAGRRTRQALLAVGILVLGGCAIGPNYELPTTEVPTAWQDGQWKSAQPRAHLPTGPWWEVFQDKRLSDLEVKAVNANQQLLAAYARVKQARAVARAVEADFLPDVTNNSKFIRFRTPISGAGLPGTSAFTTNEFKVPFDLSYEVDIWGKIRRSFEAATADAYAAAASYNTVLLTLTTDLGQNYYSLRAIDSEILVLRATVKTRQESLELVDAQVKAGAASDYELSQAQTQLYTAQADLIALSRQRQNFQDAIATLINVPAPAFSIPEIPLKDTPPPVIPPGLPSELLERRPDVAEAERLVAASNARIGVALAAFFPVLSLTGSVGFSSDSLSSLFNWSNRTWSYGPTITAPVFEGGRLEANLAETRAKYEETVANYRNQVLVAFQEVQDNLTAIRVLATQHERLQAAVGSSSRTVELANIRYRAGAVSYNEVVDNERIQLDVERQEVQVRGQRFTTTVLLIKALGGGWEGFNPMEKPTVAPYIEGSGTPSSPKPSTPNAGDTPRKNRKPTDLTSK